MRNNARRRNKVNKIWWLVILLTIIILLVLKGCKWHITKTQAGLVTTRSDYAASQVDTTSVDKEETSEEIEVHIEPSDDAITKVPANLWVSEYISLTDEEIWELACLIWLEGRGESLECQKAICSVVINRYTTDRSNYNSILDVIYEKGQFSPACRIPNTTPDDIQIGIVHDIMENGPSIPEYVTYFRANYYHSWGDLIDYTYIDHTYFSYSNELYQKVTRMED